MYLGSSKFWARCDGVNWHYGFQISRVGTTTSDSKISNVMSILQGRFTL